MSSPRIRLQKYLAQCGVAARRAAELLISEGRVRVNGDLVTVQGSTVMPGVDRVSVDGKEVREEHRGVMLLHKPTGVVSTKKDPHGRPSLERYLTAHYRSYFPVGRLDYESSGLVILTNDGELADRLLHPRYGAERRYEVEVEGAVTQATLRSLQRGVELDDGPVRPKVSLLEGLEGRTKLLVSITEGRNRIVRRLMDAVGHPVISLLRVMHGPMRLGRLRPGQVRRLTEREYHTLRRQVLGAEAAAGSSASRQRHRDAHPQDTGTGRRASRDETRKGRPGRHRVRIRQH